MRIQLLNQTGKRSTKKKKKKASATLIKVLFLKLKGILFMLTGNEFIAVIFQ